VASQPVPRQVRKRAGKAGVNRPEEAVRLVDIRARAPGRQAGAAESPGRSGPRVRFAVRAHWRNQWYPGSQTHRPRYIEEFIKGPDDAPFRAPKTVYVLRQPGEPARPRDDPGPELEP
jgi:hypothetical protein